MWLQKDSFTESLLFLFYNCHWGGCVWLQKERIKAEASQFASAGAPPASQQPAGCRAEPATARARAGRAQAEVGCPAVVLLQCGPVLVW